MHFMILNHKCDFCYARDYQLRGLPNGAFVPLTLYQGLATGPLDLLCVEFKKILKLNYGQHFLCQTARFELEYNHFYNQT